MKVVVISTVWYLTNKGEHTTFYKITQKYIIKPVAGQTSFASRNSCHMSTVACVPERLWQATATLMS